MRHYPAKNNPLGLETSVFKLSDLSPLYSGHVYVEARVLDSVKKHGLLNPLVVVPRKIIEHKLSFYTERSEHVRKDAQFYVYTGNNRYFALRELGADSVDAYVAPSLEVLPDWEAQMHINPVFFEDAANGRPY